MDLDENRNLLEPMSLTEEKNVCCLCCQSGPLLLSVTIQKRIHYAGEQIVFSVEVDNRETEKTLGRIEAKLKAFYTFISESGNTTSGFTKREASVRLAESMVPRREQKWNNVILDIPTHTTPSFDNCKSINLSYLFTVKIRISFAINPKVVFPITISSRPHMVQEASQQFSSMALPLPATDVQPSMVRLPKNSTNPTVSSTAPQHCPPIVTQQPQIFYVSYKL